MNVLKKIDKHFFKKDDIEKANQHDTDMYAESEVSSAGASVNQGWYEDPGTGVKTDGNGNYLIEDYQSDWWMVMGK